MPRCGHVQDEMMCLNQLTRENIKYGHHLCDDCSGRSEANQRLSRHKRPVVKARCEQLELFEVAHA